MSSPIRILDILGIDTQEDRYSDLIAGAFRAHGQFRERLLEKLLGRAPAASDWQAHTRSVFRSEDGRDLPDIVLVSRTERMAVVIENKVHAKEGRKQTERYAADRVRNLMATRFELVEAAFRFFYLTPSGERPASAAFEILRYADVAGAIPEDPGGDRVGLLLQEFRERVRECESAAVASPTATIREYLHPRRLVTRPRLFHGLLDALEVPPGFEREIGWTANGIHGEIPWAQWFKPAWVTQPAGEWWGVAVHYELQWEHHDRDPRLATYIHFEPKPYRTKQERKEDGAAGEAFRRQHAAFTQHLKRSRDSLSAAGWALEKRQTVPRCDFGHGVTIRELADRLRTLVASAAPIVEEAILEATPALAPHPPA